MEELYRRLAALPGVIAAGDVTRLPLAGVGGNPSSNIEVEGRPVPRDQLPQIDFRRASRDYFRAMGVPLVDVIENNDAFVFQADLPGVAAADIDVSYENGMLTLSAHANPRQPQGQRYVWREYGVGHYYRQFTISTPVDPDGIKAEYRNGVLEVSVPKAAAARTRKIPIKSA